MPRARRYSCAAAAEALGVSQTYFTARWRGWVAEGRLPAPMLFNPRRPKFDADAIDRIAAAGGWEDAPRPARAEPVSAEGDPELARRSRELAGLA